MNGTKGKFFRRLRLIRVSRMRLRGLIALVGLAFVAAGLWAIYPPLAPIAAGGLLILDAYWRE